jgi:hypothetical protein
MNWKQKWLLLRLFALGSVGTVIALQPGSVRRSVPTETCTDSELDASHRSIYAAHWEEILVSEFQHTSYELKEQRRSWTRQRLEQSGVSIFGATAEPDTELFGEKVVRIVKPHTTAPLRDKFSRGDVLLLTPNVPNIDPIPRESLVIDVGKDWITLGVGPTWPPGLWEARKLVGFYQIRLDRAAPQAPLKAQKRALQRLVQGQAGTAAGLLAHIFQNSTGVDKSSSVVPSWLNTSPGNDQLEESIRSALEETKIKTPFEPNQSQEDAIVWALKRRLSLIRGPPGTGKTRVAALLISTALKMASLKNGDSSPPPRILAVTHSNGAADVLLEALLQVGVPAVRLGRPASVSPKVQHRTVVAIAEKLPHMVELRRITGSANVDPQSRSGAAFELRQGMIDMQQLITQTAPVVVTSCIGAHQLFSYDDEKEENTSPFSMVVLDEAAQTTEPALVCALAAAKAEQLVMVGDTRQLPPTITFMDLRDTLGVSPMARLEKAGVGLFTLQTQYRMPPSLLEHPSNYFYKGMIGCADQIIEQSKKDPLPQGFEWPNGTLPLAFINVGNGDSEIVHSFGGRSNPAEAKLVTEIVSCILDAGEVDASSIAVISPYAKQVQLLRTELATRALHPKAHSVRVGTVDSFQGQETDIVLISAVRSNPLQELGFLRDSRRLCVAITRAKRGLIILGDRSVLRSCRHWGALLQSCDDRNGSLEALDFERSTRTGLPKITPSRFDAMELFDDNDELYGLFSDPASSTPGQEA